MYVYFCLSTIIIYNLQSVNYIVPRACPWESIFLCSFLSNLSVTCTEGFSSFEKRTRFPNLPSNLVTNSSAHDGVKVVTPSKSRSISSSLFMSWSNGSIAAKASRPSCLDIKMSPKFFSLIFIYSILLQDCLIIPFEQILIQDYDQTSCFL